MKLYPANLNTYLDNTIFKYPLKTALIYDNKQFTYDYLNQKINQMANEIVSRGVTKGDRIVVCLGNSFELIVAFWATLKTGGIVSIVAHNTPIDKIQYIIDDTTAKIIISNRELSNKLTMNELTSKLSNFLLIEEISDDVNDIADNSPKEWPVQVLDTDIASIIYTSGSTGEPKGVTLSHHNMSVATSSLLQYLNYAYNDNVLCVLPLSFDYGLYQMIMSFAVGATLILEKDFALPLKPLKMIKDYNITILPLVPSMVNILSGFNQKFKFDLSSIKCITNTGASLALQHIDTLKNVFPQAKIFSMYGLTECKRCTYLPPEYIDLKPTSVGIAIPNTELWIIDENDNKLGANQIGQLVIRGSTVMQGYWNKPIQTNKKIKIHGDFGEKVLYTGDLCYLDDDGFLYFHGRMDEMIKSRGIKVSPKEVEDVILSMDEVKETAVFGMQNAQYGETLFAAIVATETITKADIINYCSTKLEKEKIPHHIMIVQNLPKTNNGKIDKIQLKLVAESTIIN